MIGTDPSIQQVSDRFLDLGCSRMFVKQLAPNDNSKNQPYIAKERSLIGFSILPVQNVREEGRNFKADLDLRWLLDDGTLESAAAAKLIQYRRYSPPEVRLSGFLRGAPHAPSALMTSRQEGRVLLLGVRADGAILARAAGPESRLAHDIEMLVSGGALRRVAALYEMELTRDAGASTTDALVHALGEVARRGPIDGKRLTSGGDVIPYRARNAAGMTLEAELGIGANSSPLPDYLGWELKVMGTSGPGRVPTPSKAITTMTPEPTGGHYVAPGFLSFMAAYGHPNLEHSRTDFTDRLKAGVPGRRSQAALRIDGLSLADRENPVVDPAGQLALVMADGVEGATWSFTKLVEHWNRKHARTVFVPYWKSTVREGAYEFGDWALLGRDSEFSRFLVSLHDGNSYFDPGMNVKHATGIPVPKKRSQFRTPFRSLDQLYRSLERAELRS